MRRSYLQRTLDKPCCFNGQSGKKQNDKTSTHTFDLTAVSKKKTGLCFTRMTRDVASILQLPLLSGVTMLIWISIWCPWFSCIRGWGGWVGVVWCGVTGELSKNMHHGRRRKFRVQADELFAYACGHWAQRQWDIDLQVYPIKLSSPGSLYNCNYIHSERTSQIPVPGTDQYWLVMLYS